MLGEILSEAKAEGFAMGFLPSLRFFFLVVEMMQRLRTDAGERNEIWTLSGKAP